MCFDILQHLIDMDYVQMLDTRAFANLTGY